MARTGKTLLIIVAIHVNVTSNKMFLYIIIISDASDGPHRGETLQQTIGSRNEASYQISSSLEGKNKLPHPLRKGSGRNEKKNQDQCGVRKLIRTRKECGVSEQVEDMEEEIKRRGLKEAKKSVIREGKSTCAREVPAFLGKPFAAQSGTLKRHCLGGSQGD